MASAPGTIPPPVTWAQRHNLLFVIFEVECKDIEHNITENSLHFKGVNAVDANIKYDVTLNFLHPVDATKATSKNIGRCLEFTIPKKESGPFWPSLTAEKKLHFLKANFAKWKNESEDEDDYEPDMNMMGNNFGGVNFDNFDDLPDDDSDDNIPSLSNNDEDDDDEKDEGADKIAKEADK